MISVKVLADRVLVALPPRQDEFVSAGGIVLVKDPDRLYAPTQGIVVQLGEKSGTVDLDDARATVNEYFVGLSNRVPKWENGTWIEFPAKDVKNELDDALRMLASAPFDVAVGDCVLFSRAAGEEVHIDGIDYVILREAEIIGVVEPANTEAA